MVKCMYSKHIYRNIDTNRELVLDWNTLLTINMLENVYRNSMK